MDSKDTFTAAVQAASGLPETVRLRAHQVIALREHRFDATYIQFLDEQIQLCARGPDWNRRLQARRAALAPYCDVPMVDGVIETSGKHYHIDIDARSGVVVHWEEYEGQYHSQQTPGGDSSTRANAGLGTPQE